ncbi:MAG: glycerol-3-phosphate 1-O-acyltransferase PlsY [candidate division NC10 bacterium]|jgi:glycerol-3-phosphate acyltransferase PlsY
MPGLQDLSLVFVAYLIGSIPFGLLISQVVGRVDIRRFGSGNIGTANVLRIVGKRAAALTLLGDLLKGFLPTLAALLLGGSELLVAGVGLAAVLGHNWSVYLRFAGGKGVATSFGALFAMTPLPALLGFLVWLGVVLVFRYTSLAALAASVCIPPLIFFSIGSGPYFTFSLLATLLIFVRHRDNIQRLWAGTEHRVGQQVHEG